MDPVPPGHGERGSEPIPTSVYCWCGRPLIRTSLDDRGLCVIHGDYVPPDEREEQDG